MKHVMFDNHPETKARCWRVEDKGTGEVIMISPDDVLLQMKHCRLRNDYGLSMEIFSRKKPKQPCAYVECRQVRFFELPATKLEVFDQWRSDHRIAFNPHRLPFWHFPEDFGYWKMDNPGRSPLEYDSNMDDLVFSEIISKGTDLFIPTDEEWLI